MSMVSGSLGELVCPSCASEHLIAAGCDLLCDACSRRYPEVAGLPCLVPDPERWRVEWRARMQTCVAALDRRIASWRRDAARPSLLPRTRARLTRVADAMRCERERLAAFGRLLGEPRQAPSLYRATPTDAQAALECDEHVFRDWVWGVGEVDALREFAERLLPERPKSLALYGAGAGRLAVDIHRSLEVDRSFALDSNPLPLRIARQLLAGETLELHEFVMWPNRDEDVVVQRSLSYAEPVPPGLSLLVADALHPPFAPGSLDCVLTCWFIDAVRTDLRALAPRINRVLRPGGIWLNVGPLRWKEPLARAYSVEEVHEIVELAGFAVVSRDRASLPYFATPLGGTRAFETVFGFAARKTGEAAPFADEEVAPAWLTDPTLPVAATPGMASLQHSAIIAAGILSLVDGSRSLAQMTELLADKWKLNPEEVTVQLRAFFSSSDLER